MRLAIVFAQKGFFFSHDFSSFEMFFSSAHKFFLSFFVFKHQIMGFARRDWFSEAAIGQKREAKTKAKRDAVAAAAAAGKGIEKAGGSGSAGDNGSGISRKSVYSACLGAAATQVRKSRGEGFRLDGE